MSQPARNDKYAEILHRADQRQAVPPGPHLIDDEDLLLQWSLGELTSQQHSAIVKHLAACGRCRAELAAMVRAGAIQLPEVEQESPAFQQPAPVSPSRAQPAWPSSPRRRQWRNLGLLAVATAASLLIAVLSWQWPRSKTGPLLALAEQELAGGNSAAAMSRVENLLRTGANPAVTDRAVKLLERSGYTLARDNLQKGDFRQVLDIQQRVSDWQASSSRLVNLKIQAERQIPAEYVLAQGGLLTDYGYNMDGSSSQKALPEVDQAIEHLLSELAQAVTEHPHGVELKLNYGQLLLNLKRLEEAREQFTAALALAPDDALTRLGMGLVEFERGAYEKALLQFERAAALAPKNPSACMNAAMCLEQLGRHAEAQSYWRRAAALTDDAKLRQQIEAQEVKNSPLQNP